MQTFVVKLASGVSALIASICLSICNLSADTTNVAEVAQLSGESSVIGLRMTMTVLPVFGLLLAVWYFRKKYILTDEKIAEMNESIKSA